MQFSPFSHHLIPLRSKYRPQHHFKYTLLNWWIGSGSKINWPQRSLDLTPLDFCLWSFMKSKVYRRKMDIRDKLLDHIMHAFACTM
jgi:hypothetical protein